MARYALVFPGQGSQYPGMGKDLFAHNQGVRDLFAEAGEVLGRDLAKLCFEGSEEALARTENTQPAVLMADLAAWRAFSSRVAEPPLAAAGHSLGELAALYAAGCVALPDLLRLVEKRALYHKEAMAPGEGVMAAVTGLDRGEVEALCLAASTDGLLASLAADNGPAQLVVSGHRPAVEEVMARVSEKGGRAALLPISVPCHCRLMAGAAERFAADLAGVSFGEGRFAVLPNCDPGSRHKPERTPDLLRRQITSPVRWRETIEEMARLGVDTVVELGPKRVLSGLIRRIDAGLRLLNVEDAGSLAKTVAALKN